MTRLRETTRRVRQTGTRVTITHHTLCPDFDPDEGGPWATICEDHGGLLQYETAAEANRMAPVPREWCPGCQAAAPMMVRDGHGGMRPTTDPFEAIADGAGELPAQGHTALAPALVRTRPASPVRRNVERPIRMTEDAFEQLLDGADRWRQRRTSNNLWIVESERGQLDPLKPTTYGRALRRALELNRAEAWRIANAVSATRG